MKKVEGKSSGPSPLPLLRAEGAKTLNIIHPANRSTCRPNEYAASRLAQRRAPITRSGPLDGKPGDERTVVACRKRKRRPGRLSAVDPANQGCCQSACLGQPRQRRRGQGRASRPAQAAHAPGPTAVMRKPSAPQPAGPLGPFRAKTAPATSESPAQGRQFYADETPMPGDRRRSGAKVKAALKLRSRGIGIRRIAREVGLGVGTVIRLVGN